MAIRFRCCFCMQLLAIAQRKAGTVITCPKCLGQVWVPDPSKPEEEQPGQLVLEPVSLPPAEQITSPPAQVLPPARSSRKTFLFVLGLVLLLLLFGVGVWLGRVLKL